eukprot:5237932-Pyramimonas_sp.AAC.1
MPDGQEDEKAYSAKIGKLIRASLKALADDDFWRTLAISNVSRRPADHLQRWLQSDVKPTDCYLRNSLKPSTFP